MQLVPGRGEEAPCSPGEVSLGFFLSSFVGFPPATEGRRIPAAGISRYMDNGDAAPSPPATPVLGPSLGLCRFWGATLLCGDGRKRGGMLMARITLFFSSPPPCPLIILSQPPSSLPGLGLHLPQRVPSTIPQPSRWDGFLQGGTGIIPPFPVWGSLHLGGAQPPVSPSTLGSNLGSVRAPSL